MCVCVCVCAWSIGGADKNVIVFQKDTEQIVATLKGHTKKVNGVIYHPRQVGVACQLIPSLSLSLTSDSLPRVSLLSCAPTQFANGCSDPVPIPLSMHLVGIGGAITGLYGCQLVLQEAVSLLYNSCCTVSY